jgi:hypothetical protein
MVLMVLKVGVGGCRCTEKKLIAERCENGICNEMENGICNEINNVQHGGFVYSMN